MDSLTIAIPAFNEEGNIENAITRAIQAARSVATTYEILIVNDGSTDKTGIIADRRAKNDEHIHIVNHPKDLGFSGAIKSCYRHASGDLVFLAPADGQVDMNDIRQFMKKIDAADIVVGFRTSDADPLPRRLNRRLFHVMYRLLFGVPLKEISTAILWRRSMLNKISITSRPRSAMIEPEVLYKAWKKGARILEVGIATKKRVSGAAHGGDPTMIIATLREMLRLWWKLVIKGRK